jgi:DNA-binding CsgD family transcriptional regulator
MVKSQIERHRGENIAIGAEAISARFDGPARAVRCAVVLREAAAALEIQLAAGVHAGEVGINDGVVSGIALHLAERIAASAKPSEIRVSAVIADLVAGSDLHFGERGTERFEGLDTPIRLLAVTVEQHLEPAARTPKTPDLDFLSVREREVIALVADGLSNAAIAQRLKLSEHTVKRHVANILLKLDLPTRAAAAALAARRR